KKLKNLVGAFEEFNAAAIVLALPRLCLKQDIDLTASEVGADHKADAAAPHSQVVKLFLVAWSQPVAGYLHPAGAAVLTAFPSWVGVGDLGAARILLALAW